MSNYSNLRKLVEAAGVPTDSLSDETVLGVAKGLKLKADFTAKAGETNKTPRPGVLYVSGPTLKGSDGENCRGAYVEVGSLRPMIDQLVALETALRDGEIDLPAGYSVEFNDEGQAVRAVGGLEGFTATKD